MSLGAPSGPRPMPGPYQAAGPGGRPVPAAAPAPTQGPSELLGTVDEEIARLDGQDVTDQVETYHRLHTALTDALARTTDGGPPRPGP